MQKVLTMLTPSPVARIALGICGLATSLVLLASTIGLFPDRRQEILENRERFSESLAINFSTLANHTDVADIHSTFENIANRNDQIISIGLRKSDGQYLVNINNHAVTWSANATKESSENYISIPIHRPSGLFGTLEAQFRPIEQPGLMGFMARPEFALSAFIATVGLVIFYVYLRFVLRQLNPKRTIPKRVSAALDVLAEGLLILDADERIVLANQSFQDATGQPLEDLLGKQADILPFMSRDNENGVINSPYPWQASIRDGQRVRSRLLALTRPDRTATFSVSCAPIVDDKGERRGAIASFEDVTQLEEKKVELTNMVVRLDQSAAQLKEQNYVLEQLATRDALTGCLNRRSFFKHFDEQWEAAGVNGAPLSAFMVDIDHFKSINDNYGHAMGDEVLKSVGQCLVETAREGDIVSRYGGEEFSVLLPNTTIEDAAAVAEAMRLALASLQFPELSITASLGVSAISEGPESPQDLLEQADKCLYVAKRNGRDQVVRWDVVPDDIEVDESKISRTKDEEPKNESWEHSVPFYSVTALISALAYRDMETANHSRRVADLCVAVAEGMLPMQFCYLLEIAGLLHDIGKVGVPDAILLKPGKLTEAEWATMRSHERIGVEIIDTSFANETLTEIVKHYRLAFQNPDSNIPSGSQLPIGSRILSIADAYDSMVTDKVYRDGVSQEAAFAELRRCAGQQFDPDLVERFIAVASHMERQSEPVSVVSKDAAIGIGLQIEHLSRALDEQDASGISAIASRVGTVADKHGAQQISEKANEMAAIASGEHDLFAVVQTANELLDLCRDSQRSLIDSLIHDTATEVLADSASVD